MRKSAAPLFKVIFLTALFLFAHSLFSSPLSLDETLAAITSLPNGRDAQFRWDPLLQNGEFKVGSHFGSFLAAKKEGETGYLLFNNLEVFNVPLPFNENGSLRFPSEFVAALANTFARFLENDAARFRISTIVIDPGHGGRDPGAVAQQNINGRNVQILEKDIVLKTGLALRDLLIRAYPDKRIIMTRDTDIYLTLDQRSDMANSVIVNDNEAVIFISIHANWGANSNARGYEVWHIRSGGRRSLLDTSRHNYSSDITAILNAMLEEEYTTESIILADAILSGFKAELGDSVPSRGRKANDWFVVRNSRMPAILVELGFVSNQQDAVLMTSEEGLQKLSKALYNGVVDFIEIFER